MKKLILASAVLFALAGCHKAANNSASSTTAKPASSSSSTGAGTTTSPSSSSSTTGGSAEADFPGFPCACGAVSCRGLVRSFRHLEPTVRERLRPWALPYLRDRYRP